jgi:hypothetical protein
MKSPAPQIPTTPQIEADRKREEKLLEIEEEQFAVLDRLRKAIFACETVFDIHRFMMKCREVYAAGTMSTRTINRCRTWVKQRVEEIHRLPVSGTTGASGAGQHE